MSHLGTPRQDVQIMLAIIALRTLDLYTQETIGEVQQEIERNMTNGPQGTISDKANTVCK